MNNIYMKNQSLACLDIRSFYTNMTVSKCIKRLENYLKKNNATLPLPVSKIIKIYALYTKYCLLGIMVFFVYKYS